MNHISGKLTQSGRLKAEQVEVILRIEESRADLPATARGWNTLTGCGDARIW
jgi:hypothetical protein